MSEEVIALHDVGFRYDIDGPWVFEHLNFTLHAGERVAFVGPNGSGKSTLARICAGLSAPDTGTVQLLQTTVFDDEHGAYPERYVEVTRSIGMVFQNPEDQIVTTITNQDVAFGPENLAVPAAQITTRVHDALEQVSMLDEANTNPLQLSGGQQQRIALAGMLAMGSQVLILDEPTAMLDPQGRADIMLVLDRIQARGTAIIMVTHHADEIASADRIIRVSQQGCSEESLEALQVHREASEEPDWQAIKQDIASLPSAVNDPIISFDHVQYAYHARGAAVLDDVSFQVPRGSTLAVVGPNGSGKTTCVRLMSALTKPTAGTVTVDGLNTARLRRSQRRTLRSTVGVIMQHPEHQLFAQTVEEDVAFGPRNQGLSDEQIHERVNTALEIVGLQDYAQANPFSLSGGQQRLAAIAGVLACRPQVVIMDEPTASLDERACRRMTQVIQRLHDEGVTVVLITHDALLVKYCAEYLLEFPLNRSAEQVPAESVSTADSRFSLMARLDPRAKLIGILAFMLSAFTMNSWLQVLIGCIFTLGLICTSGIRLTALLHAVRGFIALFVITGLLNLAVVHEGRVLATIIHWQITSGGVTIALLYAIRFTLVVLCGAVVLETTSPTSITSALEALMKPLKRWLHVQEIALVMSLALRFVPTLTSEAQSIRNAQAARGGDIETGSLVHRVQAMISIVIPIFAGALRHARGLALALDARSYHEGITRTQWHPLRIQTRDVAFIGLVVFTIGTIIAAHVLNI